jgi:Domain of unknown function (DUF4148)
MKRLNQALVIATFLAVPLVSHAADTKPVTRAEVRAEAATTVADNSKSRNIDPSYGPSESAGFAAGSRVITISTGADAQPNFGNLYRHH